MRPDDLTAREHDVYLLVIRGRTNSEIASTLYIAETTVKSHVRSIMRKLGVRSRTEIVAQALEMATFTPAPKRRPRFLASPRRLAALTAAALAVGMLGWSAAASAAPRELPEFALPQTDEDVAPSSALGDVDAESTRFIATVEGLDIYLARQSDSDGVCLLTVDHQSGALATGGCASGAGGAVFGIRDGLSLLLGERGSLEVSGKAFRLSESVVAYLDN